MSERILVCISPSPDSAQLVRAAARMATDLDAELIGVHVETTASLRLSAQERDRLARSMRLVEELGGDAVTVRSVDAPQEIVRFARKRSATKIVVGRPTHASWRDRLKRPFLDRVVRASGGLDVYVLSGAEPERHARIDPTPHAAPALVAYVAALGVVAVATLLAASVFRVAELLPDVVMTYTLGVVLVAVRFGFGPSIAAAAASVLAFDFFFVPPRWTLAVSDLRHVVTFAVMFAVAVIISNLTKRVRDQADEARSSERRAAGLFAVGRELAQASSKSQMLDVAARKASELLDQKVTARLEAEGRAVLEPQGGRALHPEERDLLQALAGLLTTSLSRLILAEEARRAQVRAETEQLRNALLSSVSHDLRTPLAVITAATSTLLEGPPDDAATRTELLRTAHGEALRLSRHVGNLLDMTRLDAGALRVTKEPQPIEEVVGAALNRMEDALRGRTITTSIPEDLPAVPLDSVLIEQVLVNLLENAIKYTPAATPIDVTAYAEDAGVTLAIADRGPGVAIEDEKRVFDKFYRAREREGGGVGLGLTICRGIVEAHGGRIGVKRRDGGGAIFFFTLPT